MTKRTELIKARGARTQQEVALKCRVKQQTYSHWEVGRATPAIEKMLILEQFLNVPKEILFYDVFNSFNELKDNVMPPTGTD